MWSSTTWSPTGTQCVPRRGPAPAPAIASTAVPTTANRDQTCVRQAENEQVGGVQFGFPGRPNSPPELAARLRRIDSPFGHLDVRVF
jgi:hypothetical protein